MTILRMPAVKAETGHRSHASIYNACYEPVCDKWDRSYW